MKRYLALAVLILALAFTAAYPAAVQFDFLLSQARYSAGSLAGGKVWIYKAGTTTIDNDVWLDIHKVTKAANPYTLDVNGTALIYGDNTYRVVIRSQPDNVVRIDRDNVYVGDGWTDFVDSNYTTTIRPKNVYGDGSGAVSGYTIGSPAFTDNGNFTRIAGGGGAITGFTINGSQLVDNSIVSAKITDNSIAYGKILDLTITDSKMATNSITNVKILDNTIDAAAKIAHTGTPDNTTFLRGDNKYQPILNLCSLSKNDNQATNSYLGSSVAVNWTVEDSDTIGCHTGTDNTITTPAGFTYVNIVANVHFAAGADTRYVRIYKNGAIIVWHAYYNQAAGNTSNGLVSTGWVPCAPGDTFQVHAHSLASNSDIDGSRTWFRAEFK